MTAPADRQLPRDPGQAFAGSVELRTFALGRRSVISAACQVKDGGGIPMICVAGERVWTATLHLPADRRSNRLVTIAVQAIEESGRPGQHTIRAATPAYVLPPRARNGSDASSVGAWTENGIGTQLGPNRNGKPTA